MRSTKWQLKQLGSLPQVPGAREGARTVQHVHEEEGNEKAEEGDVVGGGEAKEAADDGMQLGLPAEGRRFIREL